MRAERSVQELRAEADSALRFGEPRDAIGPLEEILANGPTSAQLPDAWLKLIFCLCMEDRVEEAQQVLDDWEAEVGRLSAGCFDVGHAMIGALVTGNPGDLRSAAERFAQGAPDYPRSEYPGLLATIDRRSRTRGARRGGGKASDHDYRVTSYQLWASGLEEMAQGDFRAALRSLTASMERYELGQMPGDVLWSWSDAILCLLFLGERGAAERLFEEYEDRAISSQSRFLAVAECYLRAFGESSGSSITTARHLIAQDWAKFKTSSYPAIFRHATARVRPESAETAPGPGGKVLHTVPAAEAEEVRQSAEPDYLALVARPARSEDQEIQTLVTIARTVNLGATRAVPSQVRLMVQLGLDTLTGVIPWDQGLLYLATEYYGSPGDPPRLVGSSKLQFPLHAKWRIEKRKRVAQKKHVSECEVLVFDSTPSDALEMAGNAVLPEMRGLGVGSFNVATRLLFVTMFPLPIAHLFANLLTTDVNGKYPFFEEVMRPLLGDMDYDRADELRYEDSGLMTQLLGNTWDHQPPIQLPLHMLPKRIRTKLGEVRDLTKRAQSSLESYGFRKVPTLDLLDGGQYYDLPIEELRRRPIFRELTPVAQPIDPGAGYVTFAPLNRPVESFCCVRCRGKIHDLELQIPVEVYKLLELQPSHLVKVILRSKSPG